VGDHSIAFSSRSSLPSRFSNTAWSLGCALNSPSGVRDTRRQQVFFQILSEPKNKVTTDEAITQRAAIDEKVHSQVGAVTCGPRGLLLITDYQKHKHSRSRWGNVFDDMCRMGRWSFWSWFDI